jgi:Tfp pilus assembly protein PilX
MKKQFTQKGFTLLLAALVASIVLSLGSSIFLIAQKQLALSSLGRDSQFAFYTADAAAECALYWDLRYSAFSTTTPSATPTCDGHTLTMTGQQNTPPYTVEFKLDFYINADGVSGTSDDAGYCADVTVSKNTSNPYTVIHADGYNVSCASKDTSQRALQRSVELHY